jgi:hypothetical protein
MFLRRSLLVPVRVAVAGALVLLAACADLLGVAPLTGSDSGSGSGFEASTEGDAGGDAAGDAAVATESDACTIAWVDASSGTVPPGAVPNPVQGSTASLYVCRVATPTLGVVPGKLLPDFACYYGNGTSEVLAPSYQVLVPSRCTLAWDPAPLGNLPVDALVCGETADGGLLYSCRAGTTDPHPGELGHVGQATDHECLYSLSGQSLLATDFDILTAE